MIYSRLTLLANIGYTTYLKYIIKFKLDSKKYESELYLHTKNYY